MNFYVVFCQNCLIMKKTFFLFAFCMLLVTLCSSCKESSVGEKFISCEKTGLKDDEITSEVMRVGRYLGGMQCRSSYTGTCIIFQNGDVLKTSDYKGSFACALKEGDVVSYRRTKEGFELLKVVSFAEAK